MKTKMILAVAVLLCAGFASAQDGGQGGRQGRRGGQFGQNRGPQNESQLAFRADVQADLAVTAEQKTKLTELQTKQRESMRGAGGTGGAGGAGGVRGGNRGGQQMTDAEREAFRKAQQERRAQMIKDLSGILNEGQMKRLGEIRVQLMGNRAVMQAEIQKELGLATAQVTRIEDLQQKQQTANRALQEKVRNNEMTREDMQKSLENNNKILDEELGKVLTPDQSAKLKAMGGKPFKAAPPQGRGGGR